MTELLLINFDLAFEVLNAYGTDSVQAFTAAARKLADSGDYKGIQQLISNMKTTSTDQEADQVDFKKQNNLASQFKEALEARSYGNFRSALVSKACHKRIQSCYPCMIKPGLSAYRIWKDIFSLVGICLFAASQDSIKGHLYLIYSFASHIYLHIGVPESQPLSKMP